MRVVAAIGIQLLNPTSLNPKRSTRLGLVLAASLLGPVLGVLLTSARLAKWEAKQGTPRM